MFIYIINIYIYIFVNELSKGSCMWGGISLCYTRVLTKLYRTTPTAAKHTECVCLTVCVCAVASTLDKHINLIAENNPKLMFHDV